MVPCNAFLLQTLLRVALSEWASCWGLAVRVTDQDTKLGSQFRHARGAHMQRSASHYPAPRVRRLCSLSCCAHKFAYAVDHCQMPPLAQTLTLQQGGGLLLHRGCFRKPSASKTVSTPRSFDTQIYITIIQSTRTQVQSKWVVLWVVRAREGRSSCCAWAELGNSR